MPNPNINVEVQNQPLQVVVQNPYHIPNPLPVTITNETSSKLLPPIFAVGKRIHYGSTGAGSLTEVFAVAGEWALLASVENNGRISKGWYYVPSLGQYWNAA